MKQPSEDPSRMVRKLSQQLDWNLLKTFHEIVRANGITAAANVSLSKQSTMSLALKRLEETLGCRLCQRGRAGFYLTDEGRILFEYVVSILGAMDEMQLALENASELISGKLRISTISNFSCLTLDEIYKTYCRCSPEVAISIDVLAWDGITKSIVNNDYDIGISPILDKHHDLRYDFLTTEFHNIYCSRQHCLYGTSPDISSLAEEAFILTGADEPDSLTSFRLRHRLGREVTARTPNLEEAKRLTLAGVGICILPEELVASEVGNGSLWPLMARSEEMTCDIYIISNIHAPKSSAKAAFLDLATTDRGVAAQRPSRASRKGSGGLSGWA